MKVLRAFIRDAVVQEQRKTVTREKSSLSKQITADIIGLIKNYISGTDPDSMEGFMGEKPTSTSLIDGVRAGPYDWPFELDMTDEDTIYAYPDGAGYIYVDFKIIPSERFQNTSEFNLSASAGVDYENFANISLYLESHPKISFTALRQIYSELRETIKHEITHLAQEPPLKSKNRSEMIHSHEEPGSFNYFMDDFEVEAYVDGLYDRAKINRRPLGDEISDYINTQIKPKGKITKKEAKEVYEKWTSWAKRRYSHAKF